MYTRHGHQIPGTPVDPEPFPGCVARCGGPTLCEICTMDAVRGRLEMEATPEVSTRPLDENDLRVKALDMAMAWHEKKDKDKHDMHRASESDIVGTAEKFNRFLQRG